MSYCSLSSEHSDPHERYLGKLRTDNIQKPFIQHTVVRGGYLILIPWSSITRVADLVLGLGGGICSIATLGRHKATFKVAMTHLQESRDIVAAPYKNLLKTINPWSTCGGAQNGILTALVQTELENFAKQCLASKNYGSRQISSRLTYALFTVASLITRLVDCALGLIAMVFSLLLLGKNGSLNSFVCSGLRVTGIVHDVFYGIIKTINPTAGE